MNEDMENTISDISLDSLKHYVITSRENVKKINDSKRIIDLQTLENICDLYGYPITIIHELQYTDIVYRDAYYVYFSHLHFDVSRHCQRLALFRGNIPLSSFFDVAYYESNESCFLGTIVVRPTYNRDAKYTLGRTFLSPFRMQQKIKYVRTALFKATICGHKYSVNAFPFSNQLGDVLRCAETSVWALMEYYGTRYEIYSTVLPSKILNWEASEMEQRSLPSKGMTYSQISGLLKSFGFEPLVYVRDIYQEDQENQGNQENQRDPKKYPRNIPLQSLFHYYIESGIPLITAVCNERESISHSIVVIGHDERSFQRSGPEGIIKNSFLLDDLICVDSSSFYEKYITIDDNQYPYKRESFDHFSIKENCKVKAFVVPLYRHILLSAEAAVKIFEAYIREFQIEIGKTIELLGEIEPDLIAYGKSNPIALRYFLAPARGLVDFRNTNTDFISEKAYYVDVPLPKFIWVLEISTYELYVKNIAFGEIIVDATAPLYSGSSAVISIRLGGRCAFRKYNERTEVIKEKLSKEEDLQIPFTFSIFTSNLQKGDL